MPHANLSAFQSARAAFLALLRAGKPERVLMPRHICQAMLDPLSKAGIQVAWYELDEEFAVAPQVEMGPGDWLLYVNYFGVCDGQVDILLQRFPAERVVLDFSQALFAKPVEQALATIYSPRKFLGLPDGGLLHSQMTLSVPELRDDGSYSRSFHLLRRLAESPEAGYADFQKAEISLADCEPRRMSRLTEQLLAAVDLERVMAIRRENFRFLHACLGERNCLHINAGELAVPLCYPFLSEDEGLRGRLKLNRVFVPTYWPDALERVNGPWAATMIRNLLPLPIDQRYGRPDMERLASLILGQQP
jgi:hypothetical protein